jgi:glucan phosphoethanolaminetransferase (alkaline phosphatase superfamily)
MAVEGLCAPALLYLGFSLVQITIDLFRNDYITAFFKFCIMLIFVVILNMLCNRGLSIISWFIVFIPFILMTYVSTILVMMFGANPNAKTIYIGKNPQQMAPNGSQQQPQQPQQQQPLPQQPQQYQQHQQPQQQQYVNANPGSATNAPSPVQNRYPQSSYPVY